MFSTGGQAMSVRSRNRVHLLAAVAAVAVIVVGAAATPTFAARGKRTTDVSTASISLNESGPSLGSTVTFTTSIPALSGWEWPMVGVTCSQAGVRVYGALDTPGAAFLLGGNSSVWLQQGGAAECTATLYAYGSKGGQETIRTLASTPFTAAG